MGYEPANIIVTIPEEGQKWSADEAQEWAKKALAGGPPIKPIVIKTNAEINWADVKKHIGEKVRLIAKPKGLIITFDDGKRKYIAGDTSTSNRTQGKMKNISTASMQEKSEIEARIRTFAKSEIQLYNKKICEDLRKHKATTTLEFWESGRRIQNFLDANKDISLEKISQALEQWGRGEYGYGKRIFDYSIFFYDWKQDLKPTDPIFNLSETRIMNIILATKNFEERDRLVSALLTGPFSSLSDSQFKWITGQSWGSFPIKDKQLFENLYFFGKEIMRKGSLTSEEIAKMNAILKKIQKKSNTRDYQTFLT